MQTEVMIIIKELCKILQYLLHTEHKIIYTSNIKKNQEAHNSKGGDLGKVVQYLHATVT